MTDKALIRHKYWDLVDYFTDKIKAQDYEIGHVTDRSVGIKIDGFFHINLWPSDTPDGLGISNGLTPSHIWFPFKESDKAEIWVQVDQVIKANKRDRLIKELNEIMDVENSTK